MNSVIEGQVYRRKSNRLEWHFRDDCRKYPLENFEVSNPDMHIMQSMVCPICIRLQASAEDKIDYRKPKSIIRRFF